MRRWLVAASAALLATAARGQIKVADSEDVVTLASGEEIRGTVVAVGLKAVVMIVDDKERTFPREQVERIARGEVSPNMKAYATERVEGIVTVTGPDTGAEEGEGTEAGGEALAGKDRPAPVGAAKGKGGKGKGKAKGEGGGAPDISKDRIQEAMKNNPELRNIVKGIGGPDKAREWIRNNRGNPQIARILEQLMKSGKLPKGLPLGGARRR